MAIWITRFLTRFFGLALCATAVQAAGPTKPVAAPVDNKSHPLVQLLGEKNVRGCESRVEQVGKFLTQNSEQAGAFVFLNPKDTSRFPVSASLEIRGRGLTSYATTTFDQSPGGQCAALYETVVYWKQTCTEVATTEFKGSKPEGKLRQEISILGGIGDTARIFLLPAGSGCVSIKKEIVY